MLDYFNVDVKSQALNQEVEYAIQGRYSAPIEQLPFIREKELVVPNNPYSLNLYDPINDNTRPTFVPDTNVVPVNEIRNSWLRKPMEERRKRAIQDIKENYPAFLHDHMIAKLMDPEVMDETTAIRKRIESAREKRETVNKRSYNPFGGSNV